MLTICKTISGRIPLQCLGQHWTTNRVVKGHWRLDIKFIFTGTVDHLQIV